MAYDQNVISVAAGGTGVSSFSTTNGNVTYNGTTLVASAAGTNGQVLLGATSAAPAFATLTSSGTSITYTTGANTLNLDITGWASGTFTPTLTALTPPGSVTYTTQIGYYTKINTMAFLNARLVWSAVSGGSGQMFLASLPFTFNTTASYTQSGQTSWTNALASGTGTIYSIDGSPNTTTYGFNTYSQTGGTETAFAITSAGGVRVNSNMQL